MWVLPVWLLMLWRIFHHGCDEATDPVALRLRLRRCRARVEVDGLIHVQGGLSREGRLTGRKCACVRECDRRCLTTSKMKEARFWGRCTFHTLNWRAEDMIRWSSLKKVGAWVLALAPSASMTGHWITSGHQYSQNEMYPVFCWNGF